MDELPPAAPTMRPWTITVDKQDVLAAVGGTLIIVGACWFHPALGAIAIGVGLLALAWRLTP